MTAKLCHLAIWKLPSISRCGRSARGPTIYRTALRLPELSASPDTPGQGEPAKCQKWPPSSLESATGQPPKCGNEASWAGGQNAQLRGHWAGMKENNVLASCWGKPRKTNITEGVGGRHEQWVYGEGAYLYFDNGILKSIQTSR